MKNAGSRAQGRRELTAEDSAARYRALFDQAADAIVVFDPETLDILDFNDEACRRLRYSRAEFARLKVSDFEAIESPGKLRQHARSVGTDSITVFETKHRTKTGALLDIEIRAKAIRLGGRTLVQGVWRDITARKQVEEQLRRRAEEVETLMQIAPAAIWVAEDPACLRITGNRRANETHEAAERENVSAGVTGSRRFFRGGRELSADELPMQAAAATGRDVADAEIEVLMPSGRRVTFLGNAHPLRNPDGRIRGCIAAFLDITERKRAEETLRDMAAELDRRVRERTAALQASEARYRALVEQIPAVTYTAALDRASTTLFVSPQIERMLGYTPREYAADPDIWRKRLHPADRDRVIREVRESRRTRRPLFSEYRMLRRDGEVIWVEDFAVVVADAAGRPSMLQGVMFDVTARKRAEKALNDSRARTHRALRVLTQGNRTLLRAASEQELLDELCRVVVEVGGYRMAWVGYAEHDARRSVRPMAVAGCSKADLPRARVTWADTPRSSRCPTGTAIRTGRPHVCRDTSRDLPCATWRREAAKRGWASAVALPLPAEKGCLGALTIYSEQKDAFEASDVALLEQLANDISFGVTALRGREDRRRLEQQVLDISEREQRRIGQDLHDGVCQSIIALGYLVSAAEHALARRSAPEAAALRKVIRMAGKTARQVRAMARGLFPGDLRADGIADALRELAIRTQDVFGVSCRFSGPPAVGLADDSVARQVYRIAQEAVHNAARHSGARTIRIRLSRRRGRVALVVRDAGIGIRGGAAAEGGMGQRIMKYRADMIGAALRIESARGKGTVVTCVLPPACPREKARRRPPRQRIPPRRAPARE